METETKVKSKYCDDFAVVDTAQKWKRIIQNKMK